MISSTECDITTSSHSNHNFSISHNDQHGAPCNTCMLMAYLPGHHHSRHREEKGQRAHQAKEDHGDIG